MEIPILTTGGGDKQLRQLAQRTNRIYIFAVFAIGATARDLREARIGRKPASFLGNGAASGALTRGTAGNCFTLLLWGRGSSI